MDRLLGVGLGKSRQVGDDGKSWRAKVLLYIASKNPTHFASYVCLGNKGTSLDRREILMHKLLGVGLGKSRQV